MSIKLHPKCLCLASPSLTSLQKAPTCNKDEALPARKPFKPRAVTSAALVAETYATPSCCTLRSDLALRLVKLTSALKDWLAHCQKTTAGVDLQGRRSKPTCTSLHYLLMLNLYLLLEHRAVKIYFRILPPTYSQIIPSSCHLQYIPIEGKHGTRQQHSTWHLEAHTANHILLFSSVRMEGRFIHLLGIPDLLIGSTRRLLSKSEK